MISLSFNRFWCWVDPRRMPKGAVRADRETERMVKDHGVSALRRHWAEMPVDARRFLVWRGPSARRSVLVKLDDPRHEPLRYWSKSAVVEDQSWRLR